jgi:hypothetical protein
MESKTLLSSSSSSSNAASMALVMTACALGVLFIYLASSGNFVFGSKAGNWTYPYYDSEPQVPAWIPVTVLVSLSLSIFAGSRLIHSHEKITLIGCYLSAVFMQALIRKVYPISLGVIVQSDTANSFYTPAIRYSTFEILARFNELVSSFPHHATTNMPGKILLFDFLMVFTSSPRIMGYLVIVVSSLGALLLYGICKQLFHDKQTAFYALILYALIPCKLFFFPNLNTVSPVIILLCLYLFLAYIENGGVLIAWLLGVGLYIQFLFEPLPLITGIIFLGILLQAIRERRISKEDFWKLTLNMSLGFLSVYFFFFIFFSFDLFRTFMYVFKDLINFNANGQRDYWIWLGENIKEFFYGVGVPITIITIYMTMHILTQWKASSDFIPLSVENVFVMSVVITFFILVFLGINRGEVTRLWIFMAVFFQVPAAIVMAKQVKSNVLFFLVAGTLVVQSIVTLHRIGFIIP